MQFRVALGFIESYNFCICTFRFLLTETYHQRARGIGLSFYAPNLEGSFSIFWDRLSKLLLRSRSCNMSIRPKNILILSTSWVLNCERMLSFIVGSNPAIDMDGYCLKEILLLEISKADRPLYITFIDAPARLQHPVSVRTTIRDNHAFKHRGCYLPRARAFDMTVTSNHTSEYEFSPIKPCTIKILVTSERVIRSNSSIFYFWFENCVLSRVHVVMVVFEDRHFGSWLHNRPLNLVFFKLMKTNQLHVHSNLKFSVLLETLGIVLVWKNEI